MNLNQIVNMVTRIFIRKGVNWGIKKAGDAVVRPDKSPTLRTPAQGAQAQQARDIAKRARKAAQLTRRIGR
ncbi:MAG: hypothetical protein JXR75_06005 [Rhodobacteraceae bacterium]|nr:hypothetical protein [Paracoccaceae bacterium]